MIRILDIALKDLLQLVRDRKTFLFLLILPVIFTFLFGFAFGGFSQGSSDERLPVGYLDQDSSRLSRELGNLLGASEVIRLEQGLWATSESLEAQVADEKLAAAVIVPRGYGHDLLEGKQARVALIADTSTTTGTTIESEVLSRAIRLESAVRTAVILEDASGGKAPFDYSLEQALSAWEEPPIQVAFTASGAIRQTGEDDNPLAHTSPGMMLQFSIAGLLTCAQVIVTERKSRSLQRLLTTATHRVHILLGHFVAIYLLILGQELVLLGFGQFVLKVPYLLSPVGTLLVAVTSAFCIASLGLLIGTVAKTDEQAVIFSLVPMFLFAGLGGAWVPLEVTGPVFQTIGHVSPIAWAMDGFKNIAVRGLGLPSVLLPAAALLGYGLLFQLLANWRFRTE